MSTLILILKIIGIVLLCIVSLVLLLACYVLFVPLRYAAAGEHYDSLAGRAEIRDLLHLVRVILRYEDGETDLSLRICGFTRRKGGSEEEEPEVPQEKPAEAAEVESKINEDTPPETPAEDRDFASDPEDDRTDLEEEEEEFTDEDLDEFLESDEYKKEKSKGPLKKAGGVMRELTDKRNQRAVAFMLSQGWVVLKRLVPSIRKCDLKFSTGACDTTGQVIGAISLCPLAYGKDTCIVPDFTSERAYCTGELDLRGKIPLFPVARLILQILFFNKDCRRLIRKFRS